VGVFFLLLWAFTARARIKNLNPVIQIPAFSILQPKLISVPKGYGNNVCLLQELYRKHACTVWGESAEFLVLNLVVQL
jgi:hypothetical protein